MTGVEGGKRWKAMPPESAEGGHFTHPGFRGKGEVEEHLRESAKSADLSAD
jgi:hypothetical protein